MARKRRNIKVTEAELFEEVDVDKNLAIREMSRKRRQGK